MIKICDLDDIEEGKSLGITLEINGSRQMLLIVRSSDKAFVYLNSCPHIGTPLNLHPNKFLSHDKKHIICSTHGALFQIETGHCIFGPCKGDYLESIPVFIKDQQILTASS